MIARRRALLAGPLLAAPALSGPRAADGRGEELRRGCAGLERRHGGRLGVAVLDTAGAGLPVAHRGDERFALCSTFKLVAAAFVLARVDRGEESLERRITYGRDRLVTYSPATEKHAGGGGLTVGELCDAAVTLSDNTAANLLLESFGGPAGLTAFMRSLGDGVSRLDRWEPDLNEAAPSDPRDTTTPIAMLGLLRGTVVGTLGPRDEPQWETVGSRDPLRPQTDLYDVVPTDSRTPYDVRQVIEIISDAGEYTEFKANYGTTLVTAFAHVHGHPVGFIGNNGCWPLVPLSDPDARWMRQVYNRANDALARATRKVEGTFVDANRGSAGHDACNVVNPWYESALSKKIALPYHVNQAGSLAIAMMVNNAIRR